ncbi:cytochrome c oxidase subunit 6b-3 [Nilaparvata lugens]|uniref:cytochrome c oxidase subunit 6b-3 n=1 Tax=Nilaparvata lugens TaxID=108931 RepID=UPI000B9942CE|nr:cytochrome c oxidase subunit 6b-3 [Nilaparvata lugens]
MDTNRGFDDNPEAVEIDGMICIPKVVDATEEPPKKEKVEEEVLPDLYTCPRDPRFQQTNITKWCYQMFIDFHRCTHLLGEEAKECNYFKRCYTSLCPFSWVEKWDEQIQTGEFPRDLHREFYYRNPSGVTD